MNLHLKITEDSQYSRQSRSLEGREELPLQGRVVDPPPELYIYIINRSTRGSRNFLLIFKISFVHRNYANNAQTVIKKIPSIRIASLRITNSFRINFVTAFAPKIFPFR